MPRHLSGLPLKRSLRQPEVGMEPLYLFVFTQFRTQNRYALLLELL
jgi:hypothetical protein